MRFGGHQTFYIREGWIHKGLKLLIQDENRADEEKLLTHDFSQDYLGVGVNMAQSIRHWLLATGLAEKKKNKKDKAQKELTPTALGKLIWKNDPYFLETSTWWVLHIELVNNETDATSWNWFFNEFNFERFEKSFCIEHLVKELSLLRKKPPSRTTLDRDIQCLLLSYSRNIPLKNKDPEDAIVCPFSDLGLMSHFTNSGTYHLRKDQKEIENEILMYALCKKYDNVEKENTTIEISFYDLIRLKSGPGRVFVLSNENLYELIDSCTHYIDSLRINELAGERQITFEFKNSIKWLNDLYQNHENVDEYSFEPISG